MRNRNTSHLFLVAILLFLPGIAHAQLSQSGGVSITQGGNTAQVLTSAPGSDTGQAALAVRIISSLAGGAGGTSSSYGSAYPASGTAIGYSDGTNMQGARVVDFDTGGGTQYGLINNLVRRASGGSVELIGQTSMANSLPVTFASDQSALSIAANSSVNLSQVAGTTTATGNGGVSAGVQRVAIASDNTAFSVNAAQSGTWNVGLNAGSNLIGTVVKKSTCGTTAFDSGLTENIATGAGTDLATSATCIEALYITNKTTSAVNITVKDKSGTPKDYVTTFSLPPNSNIIMPLWGMKLTGGVTVVAGTSSAVNAQVVGYQ